jgi:hypothetical protein
VLVNESSEGRDTVFWVGGSVVRVRCESVDCIGGCWASSCGLLVLNRNGDLGDLGDVGLSGDRGLFRKS